MSFIDGSNPEDRQRGLGSGGLVAKPVDVYERIRLAIVSGDIRPNEPLIENDLAEALGVSRTPIRESLQRLAADDLIVTRKRGWAVKEYTTNEIRENFEIRSGLEGMAARMAAERGEAELIRKISAIHRHRLAVDVNKFGERVSSNRAFHDAIILAAGNGRLRDTIFKAGNFYFNKRIARLTSHQRFDTSQAEHGLIAQAIESHDGLAAETAMRRHIMSAFTFWIESGSAM